MGDHKINQVYHFHITNIAIKFGKNLLICPRGCTNRHQKGYYDPYFAAFEPVGDQQRLLEQKINRIYPFHITNISSKFGKNLIMCSRDQGHFDPNFVPEGRGQPRDLLTSKSIGFRAITCQVI